MFAVPSGSGAHSWRYVCRFRGALVAHFGSKEASYPQQRATGETGQEAVFIAVVCCILVLSQDSKSDGGDTVPVRFRPPVPKQRQGVRRKRLTPFFGPRAARGTLLDHCRENAPYNPGEHSLARHAPMATIGKRPDASGAPVSRVRLKGYPAQVASFARADGCEEIRSSEPARVRAAPPHRGRFVAADALFLRYVITNHSDRPPRRNREVKRILRALDQPRQVRTGRAFRRLFRARA